MQPPVVRSPVSLTLDTAEIRLADGYVHLTRGYNALVPGPTIRTTPGERLVVRVKNALGAVATYAPSSNSMNGLKLFNTTNLHTHGLHVSPRAPADSVFQSVSPGESLTYEYDIPVYHMGGTHWYHPHRHGAGSMQVGGGAHGMLIVDDLPGSLPPEVAGLPERHLVIWDLRPSSLMHLGQRQERPCRSAGGSAAACREAFWTPAAAHRLAADEKEGLLLVNGQRTPEMGLEADQWHRFRILFGSAGGGVGGGGGGMGGGMGGGGGGGGGMMGRRLGMMDMMADYDGANVLPQMDGRCEALLLAKDGVYLPRAPRRVAYGHMAAGNRADWLVRCPEGTFRLRDRQSGSDLVRFRSSLAARSGAPAPAPAPAPFIRPFAAGRPCYLADLNRVRPNVSHTVALAHMDFALEVDGHLQSFAGPAAPSAVLPVASVVELGIGGTGAMAHVFHMHVNPFQLQHGAWRRARLTLSSSPDKLRGRRYPSTAVRSSARCACILSFPLPCTRPSPLATLWHARCLPRLSHTHLGRYLLGEPSCFGKLHAGRPLFPLSDSYNQSSTLTGRAACAPAQTSATVGTTRRATGTTRSRIRAEDRWRR